MNTPKPLNLASSPSNTARLLCSIRTRIGALIALTGLAGGSSQATLQTMSEPIQLVQSHITAPHVSERDGEIVAQLPEDTLRTQALKILNDVRVRKSFKNTKEQDDFFHILAALEQGVSLEKALFIVQDSSGSDYLRGLTRGVLHKVGVTREELKSFLVNP